MTYKESASQLLSLFQTNASGTWNISITGNAATVTTNANLTGVVTSTGNATLFAAMTANSVLLGNGTATPQQVAPGTSGNILTSNGSTWVSSPNTGANPLTTKGDLFTFTTVDARLPVGATNGQYLQVNSGAATGLAWSTATLPATALNAARILRSDGTNYVDSTSTFADTYAASGFLYANGANNVAGLATAINGLPVTSNTGVPSILAGPAATGRVLTSNAAAAPSWSTSTFPSVGGTAGNVLISDGTNYIASTSIMPNTVGAAGKIIRSDGTVNAYSTATYPDTAGSSGNILKSDGTNWVSAAISTTLTAPALTDLTSGSGTYTTPAGALYLIVEMVGGGGGGAGNGNAGSTAGSNGVDSTFGGATAVKGLGGAAATIGASGGAGGTASGGTINWPGISGQGQSITAANNIANGGAGGGTILFGGGALTNLASSGVAATAGTNAVANTGGGGSGCGTTGTNVIPGSPGGGGAGSVYWLITSPSATYSYAVGTGGAGGTAGTSGAAGGNGAAGRIIVTAYFQ